MATPRIDPNYGYNPYTGTYGLALPQDYKAFILMHQHEISLFSQQYPYFTEVMLRVPFGAAHNIYYKGYAAKWLEYEDVLSMTFSAFCLALEDYDPNKGTFESWFKTKLRSEMRTVKNNDGWKDDDGVWHQYVVSDELVEDWIEHGDGGIYRDLLVYDNVAEAQHLLEIADDIDSAFEDEAQRDRVKRMLFLQYTYDLTEEKIAIELAVNVRTIKRDMKRLQQIFQSRFDNRYGKEAEVKKHARK